MNKSDMARIVNAKHNEISNKGLEHLYGKTGFMASVQIGKVYPGSVHYAEIRKVAECLEKTKVPKYVGLANFLYELCSESLSLNVEREKAEVILKNEGYRKSIPEKEVKTIYKEFKKIEKRAQKVSKKESKTLNKFKDVKNFISRNITSIHYDLSDNNFYDYETEELTEFFNSCNALSFLSKSEVVRNLK